MSQDYREGVPSTARVGGHPIHPMLMPFPIAFLAGALFTDIAFVITANGVWAQASLWLLVAGLVTGLIAAVPGLVDFATIERARAHAAGWIHLGLNVAVLALALVNALIRLDDPAGIIVPSGLILTVVMAGMLGVSGWFGGELAYRFKIGTFEKEAPDDVRASSDTSAAAGSASDRMGTADDTRRLR
jgi:uncharacterized membrane protein